ncbi:MAG: SET domain-containing protein-lysine N-methyltransferase [Patescibacteria group bacterium]
MLACYRSESVERRDGGIEGVGLFAIEDVEAGQLLAIKGGRLITTSTLENNLAITNGSHHQVAPNLFVAGLTPEEADATLIGYNHSCDPNAFIDGQIALRAMRAIRKDEEVAVDYATIFSGDTQAFECRCGSSQCRHNIQPSVDSQDPVLRERYKGYFADFLARPLSYANVELVAIDPDCPTTSWLTTKVARVNAKIHGLGLETKADIAKDELLAVRGGVIVHKNEVIKRQSELQGGEVQITDDVYLAGFTEQERLATMMGFNHSCEPNSYVRGQIGIFAMKDIPVGTELTADYATAYISPTQSFECNCGTPSCRGYVDTTADWQNPDLQARYKGHFADFIQRKIDTELVR